MSFGFALHGRMRSVNSTAGKTTYWYNALGQRVRKTGQDTTYYFYDSEGRVLGEYDSNGSVIQETVYLDNMPVVVFKQEQGNTVPYYIYADHINTPRVITRASDNAMVWRWDNADPFGAAAPDASLAGTGTFGYNPRFPGQLFDAESGFHYNYFRDYDPKTGRYLESDPIGLKADINTYAYVGGNPLQYGDPFGLEKIILLPTTDINYPAAVAYKDVLGRLIIISHGSDETVGGMDADELANYIRKSRKWKKGMPVTLNSCRGAEDDDNIAKDLANKLNVPVTGADTRTLTIGKYDIGPWHSLNVPGTERTIPYWPGNWKTYEPKK